VDRRGRKAAHTALLVAVAASGVTVAVLGEPTQDASAAGKSTLTAWQAQARKCHQARVDRQWGVDGFDVTATSTGLVRARLDPVGQRGRERDADWDVAVFDQATGRVVAASAGFRSYEVADGFVKAGDKLRVQGCRIAGDARSVNVSVTFVAQPATATGSADKTQLVAVDTPARADKNKLVRQDFDLTEAATDTTVDVVLHGQADAARLRDAGFTYTVKIDDLAGHIARTREADRRYAASATRSDLPSGRTTYRRLADYDYEMKDLARRHPSLVKQITLAHRSVEGRDIDGIEITPNVANTADGKPIFLNMGVHHAREWPSGESALEWAYDLINGYGRDQRTTRLVSATRNIVVPIVNPDGFSVSREATERGDAAAQAYEYKRKNCSPADAPTEELRSGLCPLTPAGAGRGTDPNRNYGGFWGGPGASTSWNGQTYRGPAPFSEPEVRSVRELIAGRQVTNLITNHTYSNLVLRPPGVLAVGDPVDEPLMYRLGEEMADKNGYSNIRSWQLYDTTGSTEDWSYWVTGGLGYTFEIGGTEFHPTFEVGVVDEYLGRAPAAGAGKGGNREAYFAMLESTANTTHHATITGRAPAGWTLRVHKEFQTPTSPVIGADGTVGPALLYSDVLDSTLRAPAGQFTWHLNPSTRPYVAGRYGRYPSAPPQAPQPLANPAGVPAENTGSPFEGPHEEIPFTVAGLPAVDNGEAHVRIEWSNPNTDWDLYIVDAQGHVVGQSASGGTNVEDAVLIDPPPGAYRAIIVNYAQVAGQPVDDWTSPGVTFKGPRPPVPGVTEAWTLTCERPGGSIAAVRQVIVGRGQNVDVGDVCRQRKQ
jgi:murein tripeptide amidase MpaA